CFGAHPDDCELKAGGVGAMWAAQGHKVKFVSVTNGDIGHWRESGPALARRRKAEVEAADKALGIETEIVDIHDGELEPTLANRKIVTRLIREWKAGDDLAVGQGRLQLAVVDVHDLRSEEHTSELQSLTNIV